MQCNAGCSIGLLKLSFLKLHEFMKLTYSAEELNQTNLFIFYLNIYILVQNLNGLHIEFPVDISEKSNLYRLVI